MQRHSANSDSLAPPSPYPATVDPSPVESNTSASTDSTDIEVDDSHDGIDDARSPAIELLSPAGHDTPPLPVRIDTESAARTQPSPDNDPQSVIHAPKGFKGFANSLPTHHEDPNSPDTHVVQESRRGSTVPAVDRRRSTSSPDAKSEHTVTSPDRKDKSDPNAQSGKDTAPIDTSVPASRHGAGSTPRASTAEEAEAEWKRRRSRHSRNLSEESDDSEQTNGNDDSGSGVESIGAALRSITSSEEDVASLKAALSECWTLCNTLATLSSSHRQRMFSFGGIGEIQEQAWKSCWRLCQKLYESRDEDHSSQAKPTLELCRDFCQALFEARVRGDEVTDSILRVSFELNNHLHNTQDRNLPDVFTERTLEFYLTMCHRLMKQRTSLPEETDSLLRACWGLAELLFSLRENNRDNKPVDEEMLSSAVQACWDLCDLFREGWTQVRPDRGTPRPYQSRFPPGPGGYSSTQSYASSRTGMSRPPSSLSLVEQNLPSAQERRLRNQIVPETPTTIFDDRDDVASPTESAMPNILVLGPDHPAMQSRVAQNRWPSSASQASSYVSEASRNTGSTRTVGGSQYNQRMVESSQTSPKSVISTTSNGEDPHLVRIKALILKAAQNNGYPRNSSINPPSLPNYVSGLPVTSFGHLPWQISLFESYRKLVLSDPTLRDTNSLPIGKRLSAHEIAKAVLWISKNEAFQWLHSLYNWVFGFDPEESLNGSNSGVGLQV
ncbi:hypothetical protein BT63DRAFT_388355 [Microthyrium microscopicum]|uniref:DUF7624 domain-containing protein n=1 Tax=Microthyrium microscopicum TaxID=703497 RepID=A0A6A6U9L6_9PEZI|nr:hypothetical protein BT63DRAFT_388355 [Microthyrium microscopicum]